MLAGVVAEEDIVVENLREAQDFGQPIQIVVRERMKDDDDNAGDDKKIMLLINFEDNEKRRNVVGVLVPVAAGTNQTRGENKQRKIE